MTKFIDCDRIIFAYEWKQVTKKDTTDRLKVIILKTLQNMVECAQQDRQRPVPIKGGNIQYKNGMKRE